MITKKVMHDNFFNVDIESFTEGNCKLNVVTKKRIKKLKNKEEKEEITIDYILCHPDQYNSLAPFANFSNTNNKKFDFDFSYIKLRKEGDEILVNKNTEELRKFLNELGYSEKTITNYIKPKSSYWWEN